MRQAAKVDSNQGAIVAGLRADGCTVEVIGQPVDLLVGYAGRTYLLEVKHPTGWRRNRHTDKQRAFLLGWRGQVAVVGTLDEARVVVGVERERQGHIP